ncbi:hypothetical protein BD293_2285 [Roseinatronobacter monicus]|uniref:Uncharacterized protein n=1 Tax=Roseinatronobacter monicus TaxID=393481 RepID=A0A543KEY9_9RHOB|nr:hypothetical protein BD293_2285 [Roseinatronobacter monicus]
MTAATRPREEDSKVTLVPTATHLVGEGACPFPSTPTPRDSRGGLGGFTDFY